MVIVEMPLSYGEILFRSFHLIHMILSEFSALLCMGLDSGVWSFNSVPFLFMYYVQAPDLLSDILPFLIALHIFFQITP